MPDIVQQIDWSAQAVISSEFDGAFFPQASLSIRNGSIRLKNSKMKRLMDVIGACLGLLILLPFLILISLVILAASQGPILFRQRRSGLDGSTFVIYKFRSMSVLEDGIDVLQATRNDSRVTWFGRFLRRSSIDELPQLINVLKGEMSLVGPRPHAIAHDEYYAQMLPNYNLRFHVKPGITGLAQVSGFRGEVRDVQHMEARVAKDIEYIENWSLALDAKILFLTVTSAPFHRSAY